MNEGLIRGGESIESTDDQPENTEPTENLADEPVAEEEPNDTAEDGATEDEPDAEESESEEQPEAEDQPEEVPLDGENAWIDSEFRMIYQKVQEHVAERDSSRKTELDEQILQLEEKMASDAGAAERSSRAWPPESQPGD